MGCEDVVTELRLVAAEAYEQLGQLEEALQMLDDLLQLNPSHPKALWRRSQLHQKSNRHQAAF